MSKPRELTAKTEAWLRERIPVWASMRDTAVAAGLVDPAMPMTEAQKEKVEEIAGRVRRRLSVSAGSRGAPIPFRKGDRDAEKED